MTLNVILKVLYVTGADPRDSEERLGEGGGGGSGLQCIVVLTKNSITSVSPYCNARGSEMFEEIVFSFSEMPVYILGIFIVEATLQTST